MNLSKIILTGYIVVPNTDLAAVSAELTKHIKLTRAEEGCLMLKVWVDPKNKNVFNVYEEFINQQAFEEHQQRVKSNYWGNITDNIQRHYQIKLS